MSANKKSLWAIIIWDVQIQVIGLTAQGIKPECVDIGIWSFDRSVAGSRGRPKIMTYRYVDKYLHPNCDTLKVDDRLLNGQLVGDSNYLHRWRALVDCLTAQLGL